MRPTLAIYGIQDRHDYQYPGYVHDHSIALMEKGKVITCLQLERWTRHKHDNRMHIYLEELLQSPDLQLPEEFDVVFVDSFVGRSFISRSGKIRFEAPLRTSLATDIEEGICWWNGKEQKAYVLNQELAHLHSCLPFYGNFQENSLLVHFDGGASRGNFSAWIYKNSHLKLLECHWELSALSKYFNDNALIFSILGMEHYQHLAVPGKLMGYACYGKHSEEILKWLDKNEFFKDIWKNKSCFYESAQHHFEWSKADFDLHDSFLQNIAATLQHDFQKKFIEKLCDIQKQNNCDHLYLTGGCALNIITNTAIIESGLFQNVFIPPCCNDSGLALGAASFLELKKHGYIAQHSPYLNNYAITSYKAKYKADIIKEVAAMLQKNKVIGICNGYGEIGPRALGNRSIIALADSTELKDKVSTFHKKREWYRPVAPVMLERNVKKLTGLSHIPHIAKYMLIDLKILPQYQKQVIGATHVNKSARIQCLQNRSDNPFIYDLLDYLDKNHNIDCLINTSFNSKGEPMVQTEEDAISSAKNMRLDAIVVNGKLTLFSS